MNQENKIIEYFKVFNFGRVDFRPVDSSVRDAIQLIADKRVISKRMMNGLELLGFEFKEVLPPANSGEKV
jgi:hypothetical protein